MEIKLPAFGEKSYCDNYSNKNSRAVKIWDGDENSFSAYCNLFENMGAEFKESRILEKHSYAAYSFRNYGVFLNYFANINELTVVIEENCNYFGYIDKSLKACVKPQITQIHLEDFGNSHTVRLSDGRFIVIDGGWNFRPDAEELMRVIKEGSPFEKPVIAAWIMTHSHCDHYRCFNTFCELYDGEFVVEKYMLNFTDPEKYPNNIFRRFPHIKDDYDFENTSGCVHMNMMYENFEKLGAKFYMLHTGQIFKIGDSTIEMLACLDDTVNKMEDSNSESIVFKMELSGQTILWTGDANFSDARLHEKYTTRLKADILQVPHHGFGSGSFEAQIASYDYIKPSVCMLPVSDYNAYTRIDTYKEGSRHLMTSVGIDELITGDATRTITLPYTAPSYKKAELKKKYLRGLNNAGSTCWIFTDLNTANKEDFEFTILGSMAPIYVELIFEDGNRDISGIKIKKAGNYRKVNVIDENDVEKNPYFFSWTSLEQKGIPENADFAVRFLSDEPFVASHKTHCPAYRADNAF